MSLLSISVSIIRWSSTQSASSSHSLCPTRLNPTFLITRLSWLVSNPTTLCTIFIITILHRWFACNVWCCTNVFCLIDWLIDWVTDWLTEWLIISLIITDQQQLTCGFVFFSPFSPHCARSVTSTHSSFSRSFHFSHYHLSHRSDLYF